MNLPDTSVCCFRRVFNRLLDFWGRSAGTVGRGVRGFPLAASSPLCKAARLFLLILFTPEFVHLFTDEQIQPFGLGCNLALKIDFLPGMAACRRLLIGVAPGQMCWAGLQAAIAFRHAL